MKTYYSQFREDKYLYEMFDYKNNGTCVEVGANDGFNDSNTYFFEKKGWRCILIEPNADLCEKMRSFRNSEIHECAASNKTGKTTLYIAEGNERSHGVSTISNKKDIKERIYSYGFNIRPVEVKQKKLDDILFESGDVKNIDFISIDVEGFEHEVLEGFTIEKWKPTILIIEDNTNYKDRTICNYLKRCGYLRFKRTGVNDWYAHIHNEKYINTKNLLEYKYYESKSKIKQNIKKLEFIEKVYRKILVSFKS